MTGWAVLEALLFAGGLFFWRDRAYVAAIVVVAALHFLPDVPAPVPVVLAAWFAGLPLLLTQTLAPWLLYYARGYGLVIALGVLGRSAWISSDQRSFAACFEAGARSFAGRTVEAVDTAARRLASLPRSGWLPLVGACTITDLLVTAGRYRQAVECAAAWDAAPAGGVSRMLYTNVRLNAVEALHNLGRVAEAWTRLRTLEAMPRPTRHERNWTALQRAWMLAAEGKGEEALRALETMDVSGPFAWPPCYRAELRYARARALLAAGRPGEARAEAERGLAASMRASSRRNGRFMIARCALAEGNLEAAVREFRAGVEDPYTGQGGDELLLYGDTLAQLGRVDEARAEWRRVLERDAESAACAAARARLDATPDHPLP